MKKILFSAISAFAVAGVASAADSTQFGVMRVPSNAKETIVAVPWMESTTSVSAVTVSNLVLTSGLSVGDQLLYYKGAASGYESWIIAQDTAEGPKYWKSGTIATDSGNGVAKVTVTGASSDVTIPRGGAVILKRQNPGTDGFCIMGKPAAEGDVETKLTAGAGVYSLIAPPAVAETAINSMAWSSNIKATDGLIIPSTGATAGFTTLKWNESLKKWRKATDNGWVEDVKIPAGVGAWFRNSEDVEKSVTWK